MKLRLWNFLEKLKRMGGGSWSPAKSSAFSFADRPIVVVFGSTGVGKSKLGVRLAEKFSGEVVSADSMQIYKGLDILTNKHKPEEMRGVPHHMMSFLEPGVEYKVGDFRDRALDIMAGIYDRGKIPIVVGGTNYYIEALLWQVLVDRKSAGRTTGGSGLHLDIDLSDEALEKMSTERALELLSIVDEEMAGQMHPNDRRKILRSLQVYWQNGRPHSAILKEQRAQPGGSRLGGPPRFKRALILWLHADQRVLDERINARADEMMAEGLVEELEDFHSRFIAMKVEEGLAPDFTRGVYQSIGLKNFHEYLCLGGEERGTEEGKARLVKAVEEMKIGTRRYARKQKKWVLNRFLRNPDRERLSLFGLDATDLEAWPTNVEDRAVEIVSAFLSGDQVPVPTLKLRDLEPAAPARVQCPPVDRLDKTKHVCQVCDRVLVGAVAWTSHLQSRRHAKAAKGRKRKLESEPELEPESEALAPASETVAKSCSN